jgi:hypothetical protein
MSHSSARRGRPARSLMQALFARCRRPLGRGARQARADHYVKRYSSVGFALSLISFFLLRCDSLRGLTLQLHDNARLARLTGLGGISKAQLPKLLVARPAELWEPLIAHLLKQLPKAKVPLAVQVLDTSFFVLGFTLFARHFTGRCTPHTSGYKAAVVLDLGTGAPVRLICRAGQSNDAQYNQALVPPEADVDGTLFVFDRGFRRYQFYDHLVDRGAGFITRCWSQLHYAVLDQRPVPKDCPQILCDELIQVGSHAYRMSHPLRRIVLQTDSGTVDFLTSDLGLSALAVTQLYRRRWQIETFFRWLKSTIGCRRPLGYSLSAAQHTLYAALACYLLLLLYGRHELQPDERGRVTGLKKLWSDLCRGLWEPPTKAQLRCPGFL